MSSAKILNNLIEKGVLVAPELLEQEIDENILNKIINKEGEELDVLTKEKIQKYTKKTKITILKSYNKPSKKRTFQDFVSVFNNRFNAISKMLKTRSDLQSVAAIRRIQQKKTEEQVEIIGMLLEKNTTKNNNIVLKLEDQTGVITVIVKKDDDDLTLFNIANDLALDEIIGVVGRTFNDAIFAKKIIHPDIPPTHELKKQEEEEYLAVLGDIHFGSKVFMKKEFERFINWIRGESGNEEQRRIASKVKYIIQTGDIVEGVGIYPSQEEDLEIIDIKQQYDDAAKWLRKIPEDKEIILFSGNHDPGRLAEPQEPPPKDLAEEIWKMPNVTMVSNPAYVKIGENPGFNTLLYHGGSFIYYSANIPSIRSAGGQKRADLIMQFLLKRRHIAPTHASTLCLPDAEQDYLLIDIIPDFFLTGHIHRASAKNYRGVTMINASCWTETTDDQIKRGLEPQPAKLPIINLKTRDVKIMNFKKKEEEKTKNDEEENT